MPSRHFRACHSRLVNKNAERTKTPNPLFPRWQFCQYCRRECNLTADFWFCWVLALSNHPITELGPLSTYQIPDLLSLGTPKLANHRARTTINQSDSGSAGKVGPEANQPLILSKLPLHGFRGLTVFGRDQHNKLCNWKVQSIPVQRLQGFRPSVFWIAPRVKFSSYTQGNKWKDENLVNVEWELTVYSGFEWGRAKLRDWALLLVRAGCYSRAVMSFPHSKPLYTTDQI